MGSTDILTNFATFVVSPIGLTVLLIILASLFSLISVKKSVVLSLAGALLLILFSLPTVANRLLASLEVVHLPIPIDNIEPASYIVVLGGSVEPPISPRVTIELGASADRVFHAWRLYRAGKGPAIIVSGGNTYTSSSALSEAFYMKEILVELGVPEGRVYIEPASRNTRENAINTLSKIQELVSDDGTIQPESVDWSAGSNKAPSVLLVTSGTHLPRALAVFRKLGINAFPATTDIRHVGVGIAGWGAWIPNALSLSQSSSVLREMLAFIAYKMRGWV